MEEFKIYRHFIRPRILCYIPALLAPLVVPYAFAVDRVAAMEVRPDSALFTSVVQQAPSINMDLNSLVTEATKVAEKIKSDVMAAKVMLQQIKEQVKQYGLPIPAGENWGPLEQEIEYLKVVIEKPGCYSYNIPGAINIILYGQPPDNLVAWISGETTKASEG